MASDVVAAHLLQAPLKKVQTMLQQVREQTAAPPQRAGLGENIWTAAGDGDVARVEELMTLEGPQVGHVHRGREHSRCGARSWALRSCVSFVCCQDHAVVVGVVVCAPRFPDCLCRPTSDMIRFWQLNMSCCPHAFGGHGSFAHMRFDRCVSHVVGNAEIHRRLLSSGTGTFALARGLHRGRLVCDMAASQGEYLSLRHRIPALGQTG